MCFKLKKYKKNLRQLVVAFLLLYTIGLPIKNIVLANANELATTEKVVTEEVESNENEMIASEESEQQTEEGTQEEKEISEESISAVSENAPSEQPAEERVDNKEEVKESNQPVEVGKAIKKDVKAVLPDKISTIFPDAIIAEKIRHHLRKGSVDDIVTQTELDSIIYIEVSRASSPVDISGLENLTNLCFLYLFDVQISNFNNLNLLSNLSNLTELGLSNNQISDISPLANLTNLITVTITDNPISDLTPLSNLPDLTYLGLSNNQISDISPLANLSNLTTVTITDNSISDLTPLANLPNLGGLDLNNNQISDLTPLVNLPNITGLGLNNNQINDLTPLVNLPNITGLGLNNNQINDLTPLVNLPNLTWLELNNNQISDLTSLSNLPNLDALFLDDNQISDLSPLSNLTNLFSLSLDNQNISASKVKWNDPLSVISSIKDEKGNLIAPSSISDQGTYTDPTITWIGLINTTQQVNYEWSQSVTIGTATTTFDGRFNLPVEKIVKYNVNYDIDGQVTTELIEAGELVTRPQDPSKDGYAFIGWYDAETDGNEWDFTTDTMPANDMTLYARFNKLGFVTPGVDPITPSVEPPTTPGERPNPVTPSTPGSDGNQTPSNGSGSNTGNMTENTKTSPEASQQSKLANLGEQNSMILQGVGLLMVISGIAFFRWKRKNAHS
ncbi:hypothetical protein AB290_14300 [Listeria monocytogenes]|nr:hypothetical protein [Listeria monocytogenes]